MYNWIQKKKLLTIGVFIAIIISVFTSLAWGARGPLVFIIMQVPFVYFVFSPLMSQEMRRKISFYSGSFCHSHICRRSCINIGGVLMMLQILLLWISYCIMLHLIL